MTNEQKLCLQIARNENILCRSLLIDCDFNSLYDLARRNKIVFNVYESLVNSKFISSTDFSIFNRYKESFEDYPINMLLTIKNIKTLLHDKPYIIIKGMPLSQLLYDDPTVRTGADVDVIVDELSIRKVVDDLVKDHSYELLSIDNLEHLFRYTVNSHEVQLRSPYGTFVEIKWSSSAIFSLDLTKRDIIHDFFSKRKPMEIKDMTVMTSDMLYTLLHIFLNIFANTYAYWTTENARLRDYMDLKAFIEKYPDYINELYNLACRLNIAFIIALIMQEANELFDKLFLESDIAKFLLYDDKRTEIEMLKEFHKYYKISIYDKLFNSQKKARLYYDSLCKFYFSQKIYYPAQFRLNEDLLDYHIYMDSQNIKFSLFLNSTELSVVKMYKIEFWILNNNKKIEYNDDFYTFVSVDIKNDNAILTITNSPQEYLLCMPIPKNLYTINKECLVSGNFANGNFQVGFEIDKSMVYGTNSDTNRLCYRAYLSEIQKSGERLHLYDPHPVSSGVCLLDVIEFKK